MGIIWKSAMPLLTTLAALVIIVHSAEEDLETEYRHDLRPRELDTGMPTYDQPWRVMEPNPPVKEQGNTENWDNESPDETPKRRRPGRKRKRRPQTSSADDLIPQERLVYPDEPPKPFFDLETTHQSTEMPKRRRKKPESRPSRWADDGGDWMERPVRRRLQRRKRPLLEIWPELSDFTESVTPTTVETITESMDQVNIDDVLGKDENSREVVPIDENLHELSELSPTNLRFNLNPRAANDEFPLQIDDAEANVEPKIVQRVEDKSSSDFSSELLIPGLRPNGRSNQINKNAAVLDNSDKIQENYLMDPLTLKDILKRSNGTSLSEILQQHNLSLTDLLHGKHQAVSIFKSQDSIEVQNKNSLDPKKDISNIKQDMQGKESEELTLINSETKYVTEKAVENLTVETEDSKKDDEAPTTTVKPVENTPKLSTRRRFPLGTRKKLRMRPIMLNNTYKGQLSRDLVALNSRKYAHHRRNTNKSKEWRDVIPSMMQNNTQEEKEASDSETTTTATIPEETTIIVESSYINNNHSPEVINEEDDVKSKLDDINMDVTERAVISIKEIQIDPIAEKPAVLSMMRPTVSSSGLRRQAFNNRLKRKRLKHKNATTEPPQDDLIKQLFGMGGLVSSSEFIAKTQDPKSIEDETNDVTLLDDFITTESTRRTESGLAQSTTKVLISVTPEPSTTEESAKIEIEEFLNDTRTSAKLSKILKERNMTLSELVEHRERGSSHVHLADIFHNASREPNPPEPFLSKSLLEPISKETYPLRALLDANLHDPNTRVTTDDPSMISNANIPIVMDFRNNVNENAENMGIISLFNNFTTSSNRSTLMQDSEGTAYKATVVAVNVTNINNVNDTVRESRVLNESQDDVVSWNEIFSLMGRNHNNDTPSKKVEGIVPFKHVRLDEDADGDGLIVLEDLQHLKEFENNIASGSDEKIAVPAYENNDPTPISGILDKIPSQTKSVTVATASIAGLAMILFLLTYAAFKWKQQRSTMRKKRSFRDERIPTPVFEIRKGHKNNSSTRSISPMLQTSNIYTLNTLDSQNGKDSPDYMWDSLRKPFQ